MQKEYLIVGYITMTHGLKGEVKVHPATTFVGERFQVGKTLLVNDPVTESYINLTIAKVREQKGSLVVGFKELTTIDEAEKYVKRALHIVKGKNKLKKGFFYLDDLLQMDVVLEDNTLVGQVSAILEYAFYYTLRVSRTNGKDVLIPYIDEFIVSTNLEERKIVFKPLDGML